MEGSFLDFADRKVPLNLRDLEDVTRQIWTGLEFLHHHGIIHRDIKPENLLFRRRSNSSSTHGPSDGWVAKIADFGLARSLRHSIQRTSYVATRWYRAPEVILGMLPYSPAMDVWAMACILGELITGVPLFRGEEAELQLLDIARLTGAPTSKKWRPGHKALSARGLAEQLSACPAPTEKTWSYYGIAPSSPFFEIIRSCLCWNPERRPTAEDVLQLYGRVPLSSISVAYSTIREERTPCLPRKTKEQPTFSVPSLFTCGSPHYDEVPAGTFNLSLDAGPFDSIVSD
mmetsp:Transcript_16130/g.32628  ORF Transcript_16130/g.32628 Transcript_16130/m.32628 type:complete len:287 (-) Transcript_16130:4127-4987(-)